MQFLSVTIDKLAAGRFGLDSDSIETLLRAQIEGLNLGIVQEGIKRTPLISEVTVMLPILITCKSRCQMVPIFR